MGDLGRIATQLVSGHESEWIAASAGALGALAGSFVSVLWTEYFNQRARKRDRREQLAAGAFAVYEKLNHIYSITTILRRHFDQAFLDCYISGAPHLCLVVRPVFRTGADINFSIDDLWAINNFAGHELLNLINSQDISFNQQSEIMQQYARDRREVMAMMTPSVIEGEIGSGELPAAEYMKLQPRLIELDGMLAQTKPMVERLAADSFQALRLLVYARDKPLGEDFSIALPGLDGSEVNIRARDAPRLWDWFLGFPYRTGSLPTSSDS